ncbi:sensor histidine kinase [Streptomyces hawaiiensis]|uniref:histidine kinase n=1 Tax=Streptomyces hawaiiensis TaxID=67305 RepID=A0A6G5RHJ1_9ACTN|nr:sensor histidine kinase [Streptomyces hawaiiensis]QCD57344.1 sensor histidine kinase [Streptomyces hawaiiensis]
MHPPTIWTRLHLRRYVRSGWPWRAALYLLSSVVLGLITLLTLVLLAVAGSVLTVVVVGLPLLLVLVLTGVPLASVERRRLALIDSEPLADPHREPDRTGLTAWLRTRLQERATWRELGYAVLFGFLLWPLEALVVGSVLLVCGGLLAAPVMLAVDGEEARVLKMWIVDSWPGALSAALAGLLLLPVFAYPLGAIAAGRAALTRFLLASPTGELNSKIKELGRSRVRLVDAFEAERRRIERDLHDGAQQRLVALSMTLGLARLDASDGPLGPLLAKAQDEAATALVEIRELIRGIHPPVLTDRGLVAAVEDLADRSTIPVDVDLDLPVRPPEAIETAVYFAVSEALANVAKHSGASRAVVRGGLNGGQLAVEVEDDGHGGADTGRGTGLQGVADRVSVLDGRLRVSSPPGGPTVFRLLVPCSTA